MKKQALIRLARTVPEGLTMGSSNSGTADYLEIKRLGARIIRPFEQGYNRSQRRLELYQKYLDLKQNYQVKLVERFIVIEGGRQK